MPEPNPARYPRQTISTSATRTSYAVRTNRAVEPIAAFGDRLTHVNVSDNLGVEHLHLPLGAGSTDWPAVVAR
jgi:hypothetical protein